jgi:hypothetical protein
MYYMTMEYVPSGTLMDRIFDEGALDPVWPPSWAARWSRLWGSPISVGLSTGTSSPRTFS